MPTPTTETLEPAANDTPPPARTRLLDVSTVWDADAARRGAATRELPFEVKRTAVSGFGIACLVGAAVAATFIVLMTATGGVESAAVRTAVTKLLAIVIVVQLAGFGVTRIRGANPDVLIRLGMLLFVVVAFLLGSIRHTSPLPSTEAVRQWSPVAVWILLFGGLVSLRPGHILGWSFLAALMDPFAALIARRTSAGGGPLSGDPTLELSPFLAALMAYVTSSVIYGLNERIAKAREFGSYRLVERLGQGGMAEVWRADHRMLARPAAVKLIRTNVLAQYGEKESARLVRLFEREVQSTAGLLSPHTIQVYDFGIARDGTFYYVMELLDGFDVQTLVERFGKQPPERVVFILRQVCHSLREAHAEQLVHRDMKPGNIYVCRHGCDLDFAKVLDFGLVLDRRPTAEELDEHRGQIGTPAVMAPEQIRFDAPVDQRTDIYALGCVAYWMLTGVRVFEAESRQDMLVMHAHQRPILPSKRAKTDVPPGLEQIVMSCLDKNPDKRPQSAADLSQALDALGLEAAWTEERRQNFWQTARVR